MKPAPFAYHTPSTIDEATGMLAELGDDATLLAGGQSLIPLMNLGLARPNNVIDLRRIAPLNGFDTTGDGLVIRAMATQRQVETSEAVKAGAPLVADALTMVGFRPTRTRGTVVGSLTHADPAAELPMVALALDAKLRLVSRDRERTVSADDFFISYFTTQRQPSELVVDVLFPNRFKGWGFAEFRRRTGDFAIVAAAVAVETSGEYRIALGGIADRPLRCTSAEEVLRDQDVDQTLAQAAAEAAAEAVDPLGDIHASPDFKRRLLIPIVRAAVLDATRRGRDNG
ncbi:Aerobic carbon monoxide dehydrogenase (quinone), medium chain [hydrothermal vent metagenome]|uniref:Aerobic carbon monoxide dehydrogenase (Quinone), medium chain n=1 Tax=hydrothermal vent metagenome TaxID=652676 RepID=A0A3B0SSD0_9ZZZZ